MKPDVVAPGITIVSIRDSGSTIDVAYPDARIDNSYFKGTGTSQAAAIVSGVAALMFQANPSLTPDLAKGALMKTAFRNASYKWPTAGAGLVDVGSAIQAVTHIGGVTPANLGVVPSTGTGSLEASRGSFHVMADINGDGVLDLVTGETDVLGQSWSAMSWSALSWSQSNWCSLTSVSSEWSSTSWSSTSWSGTTWSGTTWSAISWSAISWSATTWS
jgi:serine protease AprX